jgi:hypothetical protein
VLDGKEGVLDSLAQWDGKHKAYNQRMRSKKEVKINHISNLIHPKSDSRS